MNIKSLLQTGFYFVFYLFLTSCSIISNPASSAKDWLIATTSMDALKADELVCESKKEEFRSQMALGSAFLQFGNLMVGETKIEVDVSGIDFKTIARQGNSAIIQASGDLRGAVGGVVNSHEIDEKWIMVLEDNEWRWCGLSQEQISEIETPRAQPTQEQEIKPTQNLNTESNKDISGRIIFRGSIDGVTFNTYISDPDGSNIVKIDSVGDQGESAGFFWSTDGSKAVFDDYDKEKFYLVNRDGSNLTEIPYQVTYPINWSNNGEKISLTITEDGQRKLLICNNHADKCQIITPEGEQIGTSSSWSGDNMRIAFTNYDSSKVYVVNVESGEVENIIPGNEEEKFDQVSFSNDSRNLAITTYQPEKGNYKIRVYSKEGTLQQEIIDFEGFGIQNIFNKNGNWARDIKWQDSNIFTFLYGGDIEYEYLLYNLQNGELSSISNELYKSGPHYSYISFLEFIKKHSEIYKLPVLPWHGPECNFSPERNYFIFNRSTDQGFYNSADIVDFPGLNNVSNFNQATGMKIIGSLCWSPK